MTATAAPKHFPFPEHRTMAQVIAAENLSSPPPFGECWGCVSKSVCPSPNICERAREMAA